MTLTLRASLGRGGGGDTDREPRDGMGSPEAGAPRVAAHAGGRRAPGPGLAPRLAEAAAHFGVAGCTAAGRGPIRYPTRKTDRGSVGSQKERGEARAVLGLGVPFLGLNGKTLLLCRLEV